MVCHDRRDMGSHDDIRAAIGDTPLLPLRRLGAGLPNPVLVKCEHLKDRKSVV